MRLRQLGAPVPPADELTWVIGPPLRVSFPKLLGTRRPAPKRRSPTTASTTATAPCTTPSSTTASSTRSIAFRHRRLPPVRRHLQAARLRAADPRALRSRPPLRRHPRPRARRHQRPQGRPDRPHHRPRGRRPRAGRHDRRPRVRRDRCGPQRHSRRRRHLGLRQRARSCAPPAPPPCAIAPPICRRRSWRGPWGQTLWRRPDPQGAECDRGLTPYPRPASSICHRAALYSH